MSGKKCLIIYVNFQAKLQAVGSPKTFFAGIPLRLFSMDNLNSGLKNRENSYNKFIEYSLLGWREMSDVVVSLIVIVAVGIAVVAIFVTSAKKKTEREELIQQLAMKNG